jgi:hypothetical protein
LPLCDALIHNQFQYSYIGGFSFSVVIARALKEWCNSSNKPVCG